MGMTYTNQTLKGLNGKIYMVGTLLGQGGEGDVYEVIGDSSVVIKVYNDKKMAPSAYVSDMRSHMEKKLKVMVGNPVDQNNKLGNLCISWPKDALYDGSRFVGFVMPRVDTRKKIYDVCRESTREKMFPNYTWQYSVAIALNLAWTVDSVHTKGYCIGDFNPNNILVDDRGNITLIDTDSFDVTDKITGEIYKCMVGVPEMLAPELQGRGDLRNPRVKFTKESDRFSLAVHVFNLLMNNCHPFNCTNIASSRSSTSNEPIETGIAEGHFYYGQALPQGIRLPITAPSYNMLPVYIRDLFERAFRYTAQTAYVSASKRPSADEWYQALKRMYNEQYTKCAKDPHHVYLASCQSYCPWCALKVPVPPTTTISYVRKISSNSTTSQNWHGIQQAPPSGQKTSASKTVNPIMRDAIPLYFVCVVVGLFSAYYLSSIISRIMSAEDDVGTLMAITMIAALIEGPFLAHYFETKYTTADSGWPWLFVSLLMPIALAITCLAIAVGIAGIYLLLCVGGVALMIGIGIMIFGG